MADRNGGNSTLDQLAAEKQETTGAPSRPLPTDEDGIPFQPEEQKMSRENVHDAPAADHDKKKLNSLKADKHTVYVDRELKTWHSKWFEVWKDPVTTAYGCCLPCALVGQNVNRVSDGSSGEGEGLCAQRPMCMHVRRKQASRFCLTIVQYEHKPL
jgi:hypothetical protein